jgi:hypothetical protein
VLDSETDLAGVRSWLISQRLNLGKCSSMLIDIDKHQEYVSFSKDESPIHIIEEFAKQVGFNGLVVHGTHLLEIACTEFFKKLPMANISYLKVDFLNAIIVDEEFAIEMSLDNNEGYIFFTSENLTRTKIKLAYELEDKLQSGIDKNKALELYKNISSVSQYVGMIDPGESAVFRQLEIFTEKTPQLKSYADNVRERDYVYDGYTIRSIALINRFVNLDDEIINFGKVNRQEAHGLELDGQSFLIVGFGTLGKVIFQLLMNLGYREGNILTGKTREAKEFIERSPFGVSSQIRVLDKSSELPKASDIIFYTASPKIEIETIQNVVNLIQVYEKVYHDDFFRLIENVDHKKVFYPSTTYIESMPDQFKEYARIKLKTEVELEEFIGRADDKYLTLRIPPFTSRHHSILMKSHNEIGIEELTGLLAVELRNWLSR